MKKTITIIIISILTLGINAQTVQGESVTFKVNSLSSLKESVTVKSNVGNKTTIDLSMQGAGDGMTELSIEFPGMNVTKVKVDFYSKNRIVRSVTQESGPAPDELIVDEEFVKVHSATLDSNSDDIPWWILLILLCGEAEVSYGSDGLSGSVGWDCPGIAVPVSVNDITIPNVNMIKFTPLDGNTSQLESIDNVSISARGTRVDIID